MDIIPVLDLLHGQVVRGIAGRRESYAPIESPLSGSSVPGEVARRFRQEFGLERLYVADLDAITNDAPQWAVLEGLAADGFNLLVDAGLREASRAERLLTCGVTQVVAALETLPGPEMLTELLQQVGPQHLLFSLDLKEGRPLGELAGWETNDAEPIAREAIGLGITSLIVLDLSSVGVGGGVPTHGLCRRLRIDHSELTLIGGGGVRGLSDLQELRRTGVDGALVATALHNGRIGRAEIAAVD